MEDPIAYLLTQDLTRLQVTWSIVGEDSAHAEECYELANYDAEVARRYARTRCAISASLFGHLLAGCGAEWEEGDRQELVCVRWKKAQGTLDGNDHVFIFLKYNDERYLLESRVDQYEARIEKLPPGWEPQVPRDHSVEVYSHALLPGVQERVEKLLSDLPPRGSLSDDYAALL